MWRVLCILFSNGNRPRPRGPFQTRQGRDAKVSQGHRRIEISRRREKGPTRLSVRSHIHLSYARVVYFKRGALSLIFSNGIYLYDLSKLRGRLVEVSRYIDYPNPLCSRLLSLISSDRRCSLSCGIGRWLSPLLGVQRESRRQKERVWEVDESQGTKE